MPPPRGQFTHSKSPTKFEEFAATLNFNEGYAVSNRFEVLITPPAALAGAPVDLRDISLRCKE